MKIAIMQPYLFPYLGYFQLINSVDYFGIGDDVQYIKSGWINRNKILVDGEESLFTFSVTKDSFDKKIYQRYFSEKITKEKSKLLRKLEIYYKKSPNYKPTIKLIEEIFDNDQHSLSKFLKNQLKIICNFLDIETKFLESSLWQIQNDESLSAQERVVKKLEKLKPYDIEHFINPIGGKELYNKDFFANHGYKLNFLKSQDIIYTQFNKDFVKNLSIIDVLMFNSQEEVRKLLLNYDLI